MVIWADRRDPGRANKSTNTKKTGRKVLKTVTFYIGFVRTDKVVVPANEIVDFFWGNPSRTRNRITYQESKILFDEIERYLDSLYRI